MKLCLICAHLSPGEMPTCPLCGEASWDEVVSIDPDEVDTALETPQAKARKGKK